MSIKLITKVWENGPEDRTETMVLLALADRANDDGSSCYPSIKEVSQRSRLSRRGTQKVIRRLEEGGYLTVNQNGGRNGTNSYQLHPEKLEGRTQFIDNNEGGERHSRGGEHHSPGGERDDERGRTSFARNRQEPSVNRQRAHAREDDTDNESSPNVGGSNPANSSEAKKETSDSEDGDEISSPVGHQRTQDKAPAESEDGEVSLNDGPAFRGIGEKRPSNSTNQSDEDEENADLSILRKLRVISEGEMSQEEAGYTNDWPVEMHEEAFPEADLTTLQKDEIRHGVQDPTRWSEALRAALRDDWNAYSIGTKLDYYENQTESALQAEAGRSLDYLENR